MSHFNLEEKCFYNSHVARFSADPTTSKRKKQYRPPGKDRNRGSMVAATLQWTSGENAGKPCLPRHNPITYPFIRQLPQLGKNKKYAGVAATGVGGGDDNEGFGSHTHGDDYDY